MYSSLLGCRQQVDIALIHYSTSTIFYGTFEDSKCFKNLESLFVRYPPRECAYTIINVRYFDQISSIFIFLNDNFLKLLNIFFC